MTEQNRDYPLRDYYSDIYDRYDLVNRVFTFGLDRRWRKNAVKECLDNNPHEVIDVCTGTGELIFEIARQSGNLLNMTGYDFSPEMLGKAEEKSRITGLPVTFIEGDVADMPFKSGFFDTAGIAFGIRNLIYKNTAAQRHLAEIHRVLKAGGRFVVLESSKPGNRIWRFFNTMYLNFILPYLGGMVSGNFKAYRYLAKSSKNYYTRQEMKKILEANGFRVKTSRSLFLGSVMLMVAEKQVTAAG